MSLPADRTPVIIGVGEIVDRPADPAQALEPLALMAAAMQAADADAGGGWLARIDSLDLIHLVSWRYDRVAQRLADRLGINPARAVYGQVGGETGSGAVMLWNINTEGTTARSGVALGSAYAALDDGDVDEAVNSAVQPGLQERGGCCEVCQLSRMFPRLRAPRRSHVL
jgi:hypothetical protein